MREILFRGKQTDKDKWVYGVPTKGNRYDESEILMIERVFDCDEYVCKGCEFTPVIPETVGQYTGLTDKNGKKIFEGDIVKTDKFNTPNKRYVIKYDLLLGAFIGEDNGTMYFTTFDGDSELFEIIGNIHDNHKLIGGGEDA